MTYLIEQYRDGHGAGDRAPAEFTTLAEARAAASEWLGRVLTDEMRGACPDEDEMIGIECWMPYLDDNHIPDGTVFVYRRAEG